MSEYNQPKPARRPEPTAIRPGESKLTKASHRFPILRLGHGLCELAVSNGLWSVSIAVDNERQGVGAWPTTCSRGRVIVTFVPETKCWRWTTLSDGYTGARCEERALALQLSSPCSRWRWSDAPRLSLQRQNRRGRQRPPPLQRRSRLHICSEGGEARRLLKLPLSLATQPPVDE